MKRSRRELFIDMVIYISIFRNNQITLFPYFTFIPKTGMGQPKTRMRFYCVRLVTMIILSLKISEEILARSSYPKRLLFKPHVDESKC